RADLKRGRVVFDATFLCSSIVGAMRSIATRKTGSPSIAAENRFSRQQGSEASSQSQQLATAHTRDARCTASGDEAMNSRRQWLLTGVALALTLGAGTALAQVKIGVTLSATGPAASLGIPEKNTIALLPKEIGGGSGAY